MNGLDAGRGGTDRDTTRDLRSHSARSEMPYVRCRTNVLDQSLGWHRARLKFMARFILYSLQLTTTNLRRIAVALKAGVDDASNYRRIRRFLKGYELDYPALSWLLCRLVPQNPPYVLVLDRTEWHFGSTPVNVLMIGIAHRGIAFPVAWTALPKSGGSGSEEQIEWPRPSNRRESGGRPTHAARRRWASRLRTDHRAPDWSGYTAASGPLLGGGDLCA